MKFPYKFNIVSGILAGFVVIALLFATTPGGFGVTSYDRKEALGAAAVFFAIMCIVLYTTGRKSKAPTKRFLFLPLMQPTPMFDDRTAVYVLIGAAIVGALVYVWWKNWRGSGPRKGGPT